MVDLHAHILPDFDDGAQSMAEAVEMAVQAQKDEIETLVATPHLIDFSLPYRDLILTATARLQARLDEAGIPVRILPGAEIQIGPDIARQLELGKLMTINDGGRYVLLELPVNEVPRYTEKVVFDLLTLGVTPILAHPERHRELIRRPRLLENLVRRGCLTQINAGSLRGRFGWEASRAADLLLRHGLAHLIATDGHGADFRRVRLAEVRKIIARRMGPAMAAAMTESRPLAIVEGSRLEVPAFTPVRTIVGLAF